MENTVLFLHGALVRTSRLLLEGLSAYAASHGMHVLNICPPRGADANYLHDIADFWEAIGIVVDCGAEKSMPLPAAASDMAAVLIDLDPQKRTVLFAAAKHARARRIGFVNADSSAFARMAADVLLSHDFASYAYVSAYSRHHWSEQRRETFRQMVTTAGGDFHVFDGVHQETGSAEHSHRLGTWLQSLPKPCGLLAANDRIAALVLHAAKHHNVDVPGMLSVIGIDNDEMLCENLTPSLSSIQPDFFRGGYLAGELLAAIRDGKAIGTTPVMYGSKRFVQRLSTRRIKRQMPSVRIALDFIRSNVARGISTSDVLPILGGSRRSAEKRFRAATGKSILAEIIDVRFEKLLPLLEQSRISLGALAGQTGFTSENQLQRQFKARFGMTLTAYRKSRISPQDFNR